MVLSRQSQEIQKHCPQRAPEAGTPSPKGPVLQSFPSCLPFPWFLFFTVGQRNGIHLLTHSHGQQISRGASCVPETAPGAKIQQ